MTKGSINKLKVAVLFICISLFGSVASLYAQSPHTSNSFACERSPQQCKGSTVSQKSILRLQNRLREKLYPEYMIALTQKITTLCALCINKIEPSFYVRIVTHQQQSYQQPWSPVLERNLQQLLEKKQIHSFHVFLNTPQNCSCSNVRKDPTSTLFTKTYQPFGSSKVPYISYFSNPSLQQEHKYKKTQSWMSQAPLPLPLQPQKPTPPQAPQMYKAQCTACASTVETNNQLRQKQYFLSLQLQNLRHENSLSYYKYTLWYNSAVQLHHNTDVTPSQFFQYRSSKLKTLSQLKQKLVQQKQQIELLQKKWIALSRIIPNQEQSIRSCQKTPQCQKPFQAAIDPLAPTDVRCGKVSPSEMSSSTFHQQNNDLIDLFQYLNKTQARFTGCKDKYSCPYANCRLMQKTRESIVRVEQRLHNTLPWVKHQYKVVSNYRNSLEQFDIQSTTGLSSSSFLQQLQSKIHRLNQTLKSGVQLKASIQSLLQSLNSQQLSTNPLPTESLFAKSQFHLHQSLQHIEDLQQLTQGLHFPISSSSGTPQIQLLTRQLSKFKTCLQSLSLDQSSRNLKSKKMALIAYSSPCLNSELHINTHQVVSNIKRQLNQEKVELQKARGRFLCIQQRQQWLQKNMALIAPLRESIHNCTSGQCGAITDPGTPISAAIDKQDYNKALQLLEPLIAYHVKVLKSEFKLHSQNLIITESPEPKIEVVNEEILPHQKLKIRYEIPWCQAQASWLGVFKSGQAPDSCSNKHCKTRAQKHLASYRGEFELTAPSQPDQFELRIYHQEQTLARKTFRVNDDLGQLITRTPFTKEYRSSLANNFQEITRSPKSLPESLGRIEFSTRNSRQEYVLNYVYIYQDQRLVHHGRLSHLDLAPGEYTIKFTNYTPHVIRKVQVSAGRIALIKVEGYGRLRLKSFNALQKPFKNNVHIIDVKTKKIIKSGLIDEIDLKPGQYSIHFTGYTPNIVETNVRIVSNKLTTLVSEGYGRLQLNTLKSSQRVLKPFKVVRDQSSGEIIYQGEHNSIDIPPGIYSIHYTNYKPSVLVQNVEVKKHQWTRPSPQSSPSLRQATHPLSSQKKQ